MLINNLNLNEKVKEKEGRDLLDDGLVGAIVLAQQDATGVLGRVVLIQPVEQRHVQVSLACKLTVDKRAELQGDGSSESVSLLVN